VTVKKIILIICQKKETESLTAKGHDRREKRSTLFVIVVAIGVLALVSNS